MYSLMHEQENEMTNMQKRERERKQCNLVESVGVKALDWEFMEQKLKFKRCLPSNAQHMLNVHHPIALFKQYAYLIKIATERK